MRVGVIRGDMPGPLNIMDLEPVSQYNPMIEPRGQERRLGRPSIGSVAAALSQIGAARAGTADISGGATIDGTNNVLRLRTVSGGAYATITIAQAVYASGGALLLALNQAIKASGANATARLSGDGKNIVIQSKRTGMGSYLDVTATGSTALGVLGLTAGGGAYTPPAPADVIAAALPVGGPIDVSTGTLAGLVGAGATAEQLAIIADALAPQIAETDAAIQSYQVGMLSIARSPNYNPDPSRRPALANGPAIAVVKDDGVTAYSSAGLAITAAARNSPSAGSITITGTSLGTPERLDTTIRVTSANGARSLRIAQAVLQRQLPGPTQGLVSPTSIVIPAVLLQGLGVAGSRVIVQYTSMVSNVFTVT